MSGPLARGLGPGRLAGVATLAGLLHLRLHCVYAQIAACVFVSWFTGWGVYPSCSGCGGRPLSASWLLYRVASTYTKPGKSFSFKVLQTPSHFKFVQTQRIELRMQQGPAARGSDWECLETPVAGDTQQPCGTRLMSGSWSLNPIGFEAEFSEQSCHHGTVRPRWQRCAQPSTNQTQNNKSYTGLSSTGVIRHNIQGTAPCALPAYTP